MESAHDGFELGQRVSVRGLGLGTIAELAGRASSGEPRRLEPGDSPAFYVVVSETRTTLIPIETAHELIRPLVSPDEASKLLARLRVDGVEPGDELESMVTPRSIAVLNNGDPAQHADFLRELYALAEIDHRQGTAILTYEDIVIAEIAEVLGEDRAAIEAEMRSRYPAFDCRRAENRAGRASDGPVVVATRVRRTPK